jgi:hypothetical protein
MIALTEIAKDRTSQASINVSLGCILELLRSLEKTENVRDRLSTAPDQYACAIS